MMLKEPYFMSNEDWYYFDEKEWKYKLTDKAPLAAIDSYNEFYGVTTDVGGYGIVWNDDLAVVFGDVSGVIWFLRLKNAKDSTPDEQGLVAS